MRTRAVCKTRSLLSYALSGRVRRKIREITSETFFARPLSIGLVTGDEVQVACH
jgi:hypothetical protein